jgi:hypothetical protein|tara:strand:+ start:13998 stop:14228 length:231 start_codon:yes stop_codon:yes gene_type:complete
VGTPLNGVGTPLNRVGTPLNGVGTPLNGVGTPLNEVGTLPRDENNRMQMYGHLPPKCLRKDRVNFEQLVGPQYEIS